MSSKRNAMRERIDGNVGEVGQVGDAPIPVTAGQEPRPAGEHEGLKRLKNVSEIPLGRIAADPGQPRKEFDQDALAQLANSIRSRGLLQPIRVRWDVAMSKYVVVVGERRWRAAGMIGVATIACVIQEGEITPKELRAIQLIENAVREDLSPIDQANAMRDLIGQHGWRQDDLAAEMGIGQAKISKALALLELAPEVQAKVESGAISAAAAYEISKAADPAEQVAIAEEAQAGGMSRDQVKERVKESASAKKPGGAAGKGAGKKKVEKRLTSRVFNTGLSIRFTAEARKSFDLATLLEASREVTRKLEQEAESLAQSVA